jgi:hypothetical protein
MWGVTTLLAMSIVHYNGQHSEVSSSSGLHKGQRVHSVQTAVCGVNHRVHIFTRDETGLVYLPTQLECTLQLYW